MQQYYIDLTSLNIPLKLKNILFHLKIAEVTVVHIKAGEICLWSDIHALLNMTIFIVTKYAKYINIYPVVPAQMVNVSVLVNSFKGVQYIGILNIKSK